MSKAGKKYTDAAKLIEAGKAYSPQGSSRTGKTDFCDQIRQHC